MASNGASTIRITKDEITPRLKAMPAKLDAGLAALMAMQSQKVQTAARNDAPWQDQTGNARQGLTAKAFKDERGHGIVLFHTMPYGIWLETRWSGRYQVIVPTIQTQGPQVMDSVKTLMARL